MDRRTRPTLGDSSNRFWNRLAEPSGWNEIAVIIQFSNADAFTAGLLLFPIPIILRFVDVGGAIGLILDVDCELLG